MPAATNPLGLPSVHAFSKIWTVSKDWETAWDGWKTGLFTDLDVEEMETAAGTFTKKVFTHARLMEAVAFELVGCVCVDLQCACLVPATCVCGFTSAWKHLINSERTVHASYV